MVLPGALPQPFVTRTQNFVGAVSGDDVNVAESVPTGFDVSPELPSNY